MAILLVLVASFILISNKTATESVNVKTITLDQISFADIAKPWHVTGKPLVYAKATLLIDASTGYQLYGVSSTEKVPIASTTKIVTALVALESYQLEDEVTVTSHAVSVPESKIHLVTGETIKVRDLMHGLLINSGNDAAYALADHFPGGFEAFIAQMNIKAQELGMISTHFTDPAGLDDDAYSTATDLSKAARVALSDKTIMSIVSIDEETVTDSLGKRGHPLQNSNRLVVSDEPLFMSEAIGLKTGFTLGAGHCLVSAINYKDKTLVGVILNTTEFTNEASAKESYKLLQWGKKQIDENL